MLSKKTPAVSPTALSFILFFSLLFSAAHAQRIKLPIDPLRWYQLSNAAGTLAKLFDGDTKTVYSPGYNLLVSPYEAYYPLLNGETMTIDSLRMYDRENIYTSTPLLIYAITANWERKLIATFTGERYLTWVGPYPSRATTFKLDTVVSNIRGLMLKAYNGFPAELELYGTYTTPPSAAAAMPSNEPLKRMLGINGFAWNWVELLNSNIVISEGKFKAMKSFGAFRQYLDWQKSEPVEGRYYFSPQDGGGWPLDTIYKTALEADIDMVATIQNIPSWLMATYPDSLQAIDNNPVRYGKAFSDPASYIEQAKLGFQFAARYGRAANIDSNLVSVYTIPAWTNQKVNTKKIGLGLITYIECGNEVDKTWKGRKGYLAGREYAANLSAFYDGHMKTLGTGVGVKNADSTMQVVMSGVATPATDYFRGIVDWCKEFRGYKQDGRVNLCFDIINYHYYSSDRGVLQTTNGTRGMAPEKALADSIARRFIDASHLYAYDMPVWISEQGYDINQGSQVKAIPIGNRTAAETQGDWILRSALLYARRGFHRSFFYQAFDLNVDDANKYSSMGLLDKTTYARKTAADFLFQTKKLFGEYRFQETLNNDPFVDRYGWNGRSMYALVVPDETGRTAAYSLQLPGVDSVTVYKPAAGSDDMAKQRMALTGGQLQLTVSETPIFVLPDVADTSGAALNQNATNNGTRGFFASEGVHEAKNEVRIFPNPTNGIIRIENKNSGRWRAVLMNLQSETIMAKTFSTNYAVLTVSPLPAGVYALYIVDGKGKRLYNQFVVKQ